ncbi:NAD-dependent epimerase/dehydratase family protein [Actinomadura madurae]|uniref:NAD-dependent epimerase/dehydratase family protein n=1 Tax=Actinomadura madurae TaxID=1993 RepID=UPI00399B3EDC
MRCLVTGATGFFGGNLVRTLIAAGHEVVATGAPGSSTRFLDDLSLRVRLADLGDPHRLPELVDGQDWVFNVAGDTSTWSGLAARRRRVNVEGAGLLADAALRAGVKRFIHTSTLDVHGYNADGSPLPERHGEHPFTGIGYDYADTKMAGEAAVRRRLDEGLDVVVVYPGFMVGPYDHTFQFGRIIRDLRAGKVYAPPGTGSFCDVRAVSEGALAAAVRGGTGEGYNLTGHNLSYADVFARAGELVGARRRPVTLSAGMFRTYGAFAAFLARFTGKEPDMDPGMAKYLCSPQASDWSKASRKLDYHPGDLDQAITDAAAWYDTHLPDGK